MSESPRGITLTDLNDDEVRVHQILQCRFNSTCGGIEDVGAACASHWLNMCSKRVIVWGWNGRRMCIGGGLKFIELKRFCSIDSHKFSAGVRPLLSLWPGGTLAFWRSSDGGFEINHHRVEQNVNAIYMPIADAIASPKSNRVKHFGGITSVWKLIVSPPPPSCS